MALDASKGADLFEAIVEGQVARNSSGTTLQTPSVIAGLLADAYVEYSQDAILLGANMTGGGTKSLLTAAFTLDNTPAGIQRISDGLIAYWSTFSTIGQPAHGGTSVVSVVVTGATVSAAMLAAVTALITTTQVTSGGLLKFFTDTQAIVNTIPCIITEIIPGTPPVPTPFPEFIT